MSTKRIRVVLADDHPLVLRGLKDLIDAQADFTVAGTAADGAAALEIIAREQPDLAVLDVRMPNLTGLDILRLLAHRETKTRVVFLSAAIADDELLDAVAAGVWGVVLKDSKPEALLDCMRLVAGGAKCLPAERVNEALAGETQRWREGRVLETALTARELELVKLVAEGMSNKAIARWLGLSEGTVKLHLHNIYQKLGVANRTELAARALKSAGPLGRPRTSRV